LFCREKDKVDIDRYFPNNRIVKILNAGHVIHLDNPRDTITTIDEYLNSSSSK
jgi:pimeloyl-ACP methyl ester carboxylesterase